jgi:hypothetical protein
MSENHPHADMLIPQKIAGDDRAAPFSGSEILNDYPDSHIDTLNSHQHRGNRSTGRFADLINLCKIITKFILSSLARLRLSLVKRNHHDSLRRSGWTTQVSDR